MVQLASASSMDDDHFLCTERTKKKSCMQIPVDEGMKEGRSLSCPFFIFCCYLFFRLYRISPGIHIYILNMGINEFNEKKEDNVYREGVLISYENGQ